MMQFNPLFLNDIKGIQKLNGKADAGKKNKYLFSDIINVVMDEADTKGKLKKLSLDEQTKALEILGGNVIQISEQLKNKTITNAESEEIKIKLADILPEEMSKLITNEDAEIGNEKLISYIGKDRMQGDLKNFLTDLVGQKIFNEHVTDSSGVLVKLEDQKSAVNIEVTKEHVGNSSENKTMVQALIIPEKSKLQSLADKINFGKTMQTNQTEKPVLSVYSFETDNGKDEIFKTAENLKEFITQSKPEVHNNSAVEKLIDNKPPATEEKITKQPLEKNQLEITEKIKHEKTNVSPGKFKIEEPKKEEINISKITIIKKQTAVPLQNRNGKVKSIETLGTEKTFDNQLKVERQKIEALDISSEIDMEKVDAREVKTGNKKAAKKINKNLNNKELKNIKLNLTDKPKESIEQKHDDTIAKRTVKFEEKNTVVINHSGKNEKEEQSVKPKNNPLQTNVTERSNEAINVVPNKKISVKVKKTVKSIKNPTEHKSGIKEKIHIEQKEAQKEHNPDLNNSTTKNPLQHEVPNNHNKKPEVTFHHLVQKENNIKHSDNSTFVNQQQQNNTSKIVESIEVIKEISKFVTKQKKGTLSFAIKPEHLGHLKITLETKDNAVTAHIQVENEQAKQLVEKNINDLHNQLKESGVELNSLNISLGNPSKGSESFQSEFNNKHSNTASPVQEEAEEEKTKNKSLGYNTYEYLA